MNVHGLGDPVFLIELLGNNLTLVMVHFDVVMYRGVCSESLNRVTQESNLGSRSLGTGD